MTKKVHESVGADKFSSEAFDAAVKAGKDGVEMFVREGTDAVNKGFQKVASLAQGANETMAKRYDEFASFGRTGIEASTTAADAFVKHVEAVNAQVADFSHKNLADTMSAAQSILSAKTPQEAAQLQIEFVQAGISRWIDQSTKFSELSIKAANETFAPLNGQIAKFVERFARPIV
ncbi:MAG: phasin family protein [Alphaproteobacteria bacterium]|nr:phasin family protein [Alphaproteobacteria bacterium]